MRTLILSLLALAGIASCGTNDVDSAVQAAKAKASIDTLWTQYAVAADERDSVAFGKLFTQDATLSFAGAPNLHGGKAISDFLVARYRAVDLTKLRVIPEEFKAAGALAAQSGAFERSYIEADSQKTEYGRYVLIAERGPDKAWRIRRLAGFPDSIR